MDASKEDIVFIEFSDEGRPFWVVTHEREKWGICPNDYDFEWSKRFGLIYHLSGFGGNPDKPIEIVDAIYVQEDGTKIPAWRQYWAAPGIAVKTGERCTQLAYLLGGYRLETLFSDAIESGSPIVYCSICKDYMPDRVECYCEHVWWCDTCDEPSTPNDRCPHPRGYEDEDEDEDEDEGEKEEAMKGANMT